MRRLFKLLLISAGLIGIYLLINLGQVWVTAQRNEAQKVQAIVILGAAQYNGQVSPVLQSRVDHAIALRTEGYSDIIVATGGQAPGDQFTEAGASASYLVARGVPITSVVTVEEGRNTWESLSATAALLKARQINSILLVTDGYHAARADAIAEKLGLKSSTSPVPDSPIKGMQKITRVVEEAGKLGIGRLFGFDRFN